MWFRLLSMLAAQLKGAVISYLADDAFRVGMFQPTGEWSHPFAGF
jgi:hypothetical protein